jgi:hypothetical protein
LNAQPQAEYTKEFTVGGETCAALLTELASGHFCMKLQMPDGSTRSAGNQVFTTEDDAMSAAARSAERFLNGQL